MRVRLLGPVDVVTGEPPGETRPVSGLRRRALLAALAVPDGEAVSTGQLTEIVWGGDPPENAANTLQSHPCRTKPLIPRWPGGNPCLIMIKNLARPAHSDS